MSGISGVGGASLQGPANLNAANMAGGAAAAGGAASGAAAHGAGQTAATGAGGAAQQPSQLVTGSQVHQQVHDMLGQIDSSLQLDQTLKLLVAAIILQALSGNNNDNNALDSAAAFVGASAAATAITGLAALQQQSVASGAVSTQGAGGPSSVQQTPYAQQPTDLPQQQTVNMQA